MARNDRTGIQPQSRLTASNLDESQLIQETRGKSEARQSKALTVSIKVGINCLQIDPSYVGGVTTYVLGLLEGFANLDYGGRFRLFVTEANQQVFQKFAKCPSFDVITVHDRLFSLKSNVCRAALIPHSSSFFKFVSDLAFRDIQELMDSESDVLYTPTPVLRYFNGRTPTVLTMHDIQHLHYPEFFGRMRLLSRRITYDLSARYAGYFQANSKYTKEDFLSHFCWLSEDRVEIIPPGVKIEQFATPTDTNFLHQVYGIPDRFLFYPAQLWPHKNHLTILMALKQIEAQCGLKIPLVLTGAKYAAAAQVIAFIEDQAMDYVHYLGTVPAGHMVSLYQKATFLIMATLHESGGFPILESAAAGTPIIASRIPPFEEFGEILQLNLFNPLDTRELARLIASLWNDERTAAAQSAYNRERITLYSWENAAKKFVRLFARAVN
jgi:glycosyltransferase involved in cell wall biosynthesis